jgi:Iap family predicted aminopeptidase
VRAGSALAGALVLAACATTADRAADDAILRSQDDTAYALAASLVAEVGPRFAGTEGELRAVQWGVRKMTELGFQNVRAEPVTVPRWQRGPISVEVLKPRQQALEAVALGGSLATRPEGVEGDVFPVASMEALEALPRGAAAGKIVFIHGRMERTRDGSGYGKAAPMRRKGPAVAARKGARAVLIRSLGTDTQAHTGTTRYEADAPKIPAAALSGPAADALEQLLASGKRVRVRMKLEAADLAPTQSANVVGEIPGATDGIVLLGAHLDSWDITPGANDDAAGVGIVLAAAQRIARLGRKPHRTIRVVLYANEEFGIHGAKAYAAAHGAEAARHALVMEADSGSGMPWRLNGAVADADWPEVAQLAQELGLEPGANGQHGGTDVGEMRKLSAPEIEVAQDGSKYFDVHHTPADTVEALDRAGMIAATGVFARIAHRASERKEPFGRAAPIPE